jgi:hypothetical protein
MLTMSIRIPGWARNQPVPSDLYRYADTSIARPTLKVNNMLVPIPKNLPDGYVRLRRTWKAGDTIDLTLPMPVRRVLANDQVAADRGRVALQRGPLVYAAEWPDSADHHVRNLVLANDAPLTSEFRADLLNGVTVIKGKADGLHKDAEGKVTRKPQDFTAIPYYSWANRGRGEMTVWLATTDASAKPVPPPTIATTSTVTASNAGRKNPRAVNDGEDPDSSSDSTSYFDWWPRKGGPQAGAEWVEFAFAQPTKVSEADLYWFDDTGRGEVRVPASWRLLYKDGDEWKPVTVNSPYGVAKDQYNKTSFTPVTTSGLRLEVTLQTGFSAGVQEWKVR